jgi:hypothetical protein
MLWENIKHTADAEDPKITRTSHLAVTYINKQKQKTPWPLVRKRTKAKFFLQYLSFPTCKHSSLF